MEATTAESVLTWQAFGLVINLQTNLTRQMFAYRAHIRLHRCFCHPNNMTQELIVTIVRICFWVNSVYNRFLAPHDNMINIPVRISLIVIKRGTCIVM